MAHDNNLEILMIEDDASIAQLTREAFRANELHDNLICLSDGDEALAYLQSGKCLPDLICLDLHLPKVPGLVVLAELKSNSTLRRIPVIVVSGSHDPKEIREAYELHASCFVRKPNDLDDFFRFVKICFEFWGIVTLSPA
jgi:chemotaxis family two-component system response regulator Rcp1